MLCEQGDFSIIGSPGLRASHPGKEIEKCPRPRHGIGDIDGTVPEIGLVGVVAEMGLVALALLQPARVMLK